MTEVELDELMDQMGVYMLDIRAGLSRIRACIADLSVLVSELEATSGFQS